MNAFHVFSLLGGLALFLYGMNVLSAGLEKISGGRLERTLEKLTNNPLKGVLLGACVTALIQSSSATTVMVVGFVNSGIMRLSQAISIIMGANVGTTVTSWILSLTGLESDNFFLQLLNPDSFSPLVALAGVIMIMTAKQHHGKRRDIGSILIGFALLMYGMSAMSGAVRPLADVPEFSNILMMFSNPLLGVLVGALFTAIIQSSSASVGVLQALSVTGAISYGSAIPIILGQNIGTCATALLSCVGASKNAKRAAMVHLYFNLIGTFLFLAGFYALNHFLKFGFIQESIGVVGIAVVHTAFNLLSTVVLLPFSRLLEKLAVLTVKDKEESSEFRLLDERFLNTPSYAVEQCHTMAIRMAKLAKDTLLASIKSVWEYSEKLADSITENEDKIDLYEDKLGSYLVQLSSKDLSEEDSKEVSKLLHAIGDFERIGDHALNILEVATEMKEKDAHFSKQANDELTILTNALTEILSNAMEAFALNDIELAKKIEPLEQVIDDLKEELRNRHVKRLQEGTCTIELGFILSDLLTNYERVSDHCSNIAVCLIQIKESNFDMHGYLNELKNSGEPQFLKDFESYKLQYVLP